MPPAFPESTRVTTNGIELEVFEAGNRDHPAVVLCHGWPEIAYSWRHQIQPLADAGYHVIAPNQRGYGRSDRPDAVEAYDIAHLSADLTGLLDHFGHDDACFVGHDWGAIVVWGLALLHPERARAVINLSVPFLERGDADWVSVWEQALGGDFYIVHFNRQPGVADAAFEANTRRFLRNIYRTRQWLAPAAEPAPGMPLINLAQSDTPSGEPLMSDAELDVFVSAFENSGFSGGINWYRNFTRNWHILGDVAQRVEQPALMIYGNYDIVPQSPNLRSFVPDATEASLPCGHWIQQEEPEATTRLMLDWLGTHYPGA